jgi:S1-C subfamily serine protease
VVDITTTLANGTAAGTGMVLTPTGEVLTNNHVIAGATSISVRDVGNGNTYRASVVGYDRSHDVALLQLSDASGLSTIRPATSTPSSGAAVVGIGNAGGGGGTPSYAGGAITRTDATVTASNEYDGTSEKLTGLLATDAAIQSGDSGGPLVNSSGEVVGMDTAATAGDRLNGFGITGSGGGGDRGFAIPITDALAIAHQIEAGQASATVHIGPTARLGVYVGQSQTGVAGAQIVHTESGSPAAAAGLTDGDVITAVNATETPSPNALTNVIAQLAPGQRVPVDFVTPGGAARSVTVTLGSGAPQ